MNNNEKTAYERKSRWQPFYIPCFLRLIQKLDGGSRTQNYPLEIQLRDKLILLEIEQAQRCPNCNKVSVFKNRIAYSYPDQEKMWEAVFDVKATVKEKKRQATKFKQFIENKLKQLEIDDIYETKS